MHPAACHHQQSSTDYQDKLPKETKARSIHTSLRLDEMPAMLHSSQAIKRLRAYPQVTQPPSFQPCPKNRPHHSVRQHPHPHHLPYQHPRRFSRHQFPLLRTYHQSHCCRQFSLRQSRLPRKYYRLHHLYVPRPFLPATLQYPLRHTQNHQ